jgi:hypothetical protein
MRIRPEILCVMIALAAPAAPAQDAVQRQILDRLARLEEENRALRDELAAIRREIGVRPAPAAPTFEERLEIQERRADEMAHTKVESSQRFPVRFTGMLVANLFRNGPAAAGQDTPTLAARAPGRSSAGLSFRQSVFGFEYRGPATLAGGEVRGSVSLDFFEGFTETNYPPVRMRTATLELAWKSRSVTLGLEKPLIAPRDPFSLSYAGVSPFTSAGNLWRWQPQVRIEQRFDLAESTLFRAQAAVVQTTEDAGLPVGFALAQLDRRRPGLQGRFEIIHRLGAERRIEFAPGFHASETRVAGAAVGSRVFAMDWFANPWRRVEFTGTFFAGHNLHHFGALRQGFAQTSGRIAAVSSRGGWGQLSFLPADRVTVNLIAGVHDDRNRDLPATGVGANRSGAVNVIYRLAPNVLAGLEWLQLRTDHLGAGQRINNRYDLSLAYLF